MDIHQIIICQDTNSISLNKESWLTQMRKKLFMFFYFLCLIVLCFAAVSCGKMNENTVSEETKLLTVESFLREFFTFNKEERYAVFSEKINGTDSAEQEKFDINEMQENAYKEYFKSFVSLGTYKCIEDMKKSRLPIKYDSIASEKELIAEIADMKYEVSGENGYIFEISFKSDEANEFFKAPIKGKITVRIIDKEVLVDSINIF